MKNINIEDSNINDNSIDEFNHFPKTYSSKITLVKKVKNNNSKNPINSLKTKAIISEFKKLLNETKEATDNIKERSELLNKELTTEKDENDSIFKNKTSKSLYLINKEYEKEINEKQNQEIEKFISEDEVTRLKISNDILLKTNLDLKNKNNILESEIEHYKNNPIYKDPFTQYDSNLNKYIEELKNALDNSQMSNNELREIISKLQNSNEDLSEANMELIRNYELTKEELEKSIKENSNLNGIIMLRERKIEELNYTINEQKNSMNQMEEMLHNSEKKINYLQTIENSSKQTEKDNLDIINTLKETIENIQKNGDNYDEDIEKLNNKIYQLMDIINIREKEIANLNYKINSKDSELIDFNLKLKENERIINQNKIDSIKNKNDLQAILFDNEKLKAQIKSLQLLLQDREKTIESLKNSVSFLSKSFDNNLKIKIVNNKNNEDELKMKKNIEQNKEIINDLENQIQNLKEENVDLKNLNNKYQSDLNDYSKQFEQNQYEYQLLYTKYKEQSIIIENLKKDFNKTRKDKELTELIKKNQQITEKLKFIEIENENKKNELSTLKINYERVNQLLQETQKNDMKKKLNNNTIVNNENIYIERNDNSIKNENQINSQSNLNDFNVENNIIPFQTETSNFVETKINTENINEYFSNKINENINQSNPNIIYSIDLNNRIISFDLSTKKFNIINPIDKTSMIKDNNFSQIISNPNYSINSLNTHKGLFIIIYNLIYYYESFTNRLFLFTKLTHSHNKCSSIIIKNDIYIISGENTVKCEKCSLDSGKVTNIPNVNYEKPFCGLCNIGNNYLYSIFGYNCIYIEKLKLYSEYNKDISWEIVQYKLNENEINLKNFLCVLDDYMNIIIFGGEDYDKNLNNNIYCFDIGDGNIYKKGEIDNTSLFNCQSLQIEENLYINFDLYSNIHAYNRELDIHIVYQYDENIE